MSRPYSYDLRLKVIRAVDGGMRKSEVSRVFAISRNTIDLWLKRRDQTEDFKASEGYQQGSRHKIRDWDKFRSFVKQHGDKTQAEMAQLWDGEISQRSISRALKKLGQTRKKDLRRESERDDSERSLFLIAVFNWVEHSNSSG